MDFRHDVTTHRNPVRLGQGRNLASGGDATDSGQIHDGDIHAPRL